jgi:hypothetical protein
MIPNAILELFRKIRIPVVAVTNPENDPFGGDPRHPCSTVCSFPSLETFSLELICRVRYSTVCLDSTERDADRSLLVVL